MVAGEFRRVVVTGKQWVVAAGGYQRVVVVSIEGWWRLVGIKGWW